MRLHIIVCIAFLQTCCWSCKKTNSVASSTAFTIVNGINGNGSILTNFQPMGAKGNFIAPLQYFAKANQIAYGNCWESGSYSGSVSLSLFQYPDSLDVLWHGNLNFQPGSVHTLYLGGDTSSVDTLLLTDNIPYYPILDSVAGLRFVNMVWASQPISVNLAGNSPTQMDFSNLGYRQASSFSQYSANSMASGLYSFEIRDQASDSLLATFDWYYTLFKNNTLVLIGSDNPNNPQPVQIVSVNNY